MRVLCLHAQAGKTRTRDRWRFARQTNGIGGTAWPETTHGSYKARRRRVARGVRVGSLVALLALLVVVPVALAATSSTTYDFAPSGVQGLAGAWKNTSQAVSIVASPSADSTVTAHFSSGNGTGWRTQSAATRTLRRSSSQSSTRVRIRSSTTRATLRGARPSPANTGLRQHRQDGPHVHNGDRPRDDVHAERRGGLDAGHDADGHPYRHGHAAVCRHRHLRHEGDLAARQRWPGDHQRRRAP